MLLYYMAIRSIFQPFGKFYGHLVYFYPFWYILPVLVYFYLFWYIFTRFGMLYLEKSCNPKTSWEWGGYFHGKVSEEKYFP
jgi:hypothetical protein